MPIPIKVFTHSTYLFYTITKLRTVLEKLLLIEISAIRERYRKEELENVANIAL